MTNDIFNLNDLSDLPTSLRSELRIMTRDAFEKNIIEIFAIAGRELNIDEITVAYYRTYPNKTKNRRKIMTKLYQMSRSIKPAVEAVKGVKGIYRMKKHDEEIRRKL